jgi:hypothetical protein
MAVIREWPASGPEAVAHVCQMNRGKVNASASRARTAHKLKAC